MLYLHIIQQRSIIKWIILTIILTLIVGELIFASIETPNSDTGIAIRANKSNNAIMITRNESDDEYAYGSSNLKTVLNPIFIDTNSSGKLRLPIQKNIFNWCLYSTVNNNHFLKRKYMSDINNKPQCSLLYLSKRNPKEKNEFFIFVENIHVDAGVDCTTGSNVNQDQETNTGSINHDDDINVNNENDDQISIIMNYLFVDNFKSNVLINKEMKLLWQRIAKNGTTKNFNFSDIIIF